MSKAGARFTHLMTDQPFRKADTGSVMVQLVIAEQLERIADALEKQNAGNQTIMMDSREVGRVLKDRTEHQ